jgi:hypothetical protein
MNPSARLPKKRGTRRRARRTARSPAHRSAPAVRCVCGDIVASYDASHRRCVAPLHRGTDVLRGF